MIKEAYDAGVQQALFDIGITKVAGGEAGLMRRAWEATKGGAGRGMDAFTRQGALKQYAMGAGAGAGLGAGVGALGADEGHAGRGALIGAGLGAGLGAGGVAGMRGYMGGRLGRGINEMGGEHMNSSVANFLSKLDRPGVTPGLSQLPTAEHALGPVQELRSLLGSQY